MIILDEVTVRFGALRALDGVSLAVRRGETMGLLGEPGAGKSTLLALLAGSLRPHRGRVRIDGLDPVTDASALRQRLGSVELVGPAAAAAWRSAATAGAGLVLVDAPVGPPAVPEGTTVVVASRDPDALAAACDRLTVLAHGRVVARSQGPQRPGSGRPQPDGRHRATTPRRNGP